MLLKIKDSHTYLRESRLRWAVSRTGVCGSTTEKTLVSPAVFESFILRKKKKCYVFVFLYVKKQRMQCLAGKREVSMNFRFTLKCNPLKICITKSQTKKILKNNLKQENNVWYVPIFGK